MNKINIIADDREQASGVISILDTNQEVQLEIKRLSLGDYLIDDWLLIERKTMADLVASIISGRIFQQASRLAESDITTAFILEGHTRDIDNYHIHRHAILGALVSIGLIYDITILRSASKTETTNLLLFAAKQKASRKIETLPRMGYKPKRRKNKQFYILQGLPNIGATLAKRLLLHFPSVHAVINASAEELTQIEGIGIKKAEQIYELLRVSY
ncbi:ERCC4 domain-containing protein [Thalassotalea sp. ND16A]|uniref:ERCC4 domain-containing protein n=1 Tax=Thalassotalea sp. ND16A TaxID=1535422 RepID=UPI00051A485F|nr:ERCC4 domain-containing protein [Thalassotalea sp. ND16A]KGJ88701.1 hypothetical protein ND16A_2403 [Thalassotalea sp. ND16A]